MYEAMMAFVKNKLDENTPPADLIVLYPFRDRFEHTRRVQQWALRIQAVEGGDRDIVAIAAIFHDVGKCIGRLGKDGRPHELVSAEICDEYLRRINYPAPRRERILKAVRHHSFKKDRPGVNLSLEEKIIIDADMLDEVGALTVVWDSMATALENKPSYEKVLQRNLHFYTELKKQVIYFKTPTGRKFFEERLRFLGYYIENLQYELGM